MSRIGKKPIPLPPAVEVQVEGRTVSVRGPQGQLTWEHRPEVSVTVADGPPGRRIIVTRRDDNRLSKALHGLTRAILQNMVRGVVEPFEKRLEIVGVGYMASITKNQLELRVGFAHPVFVPIPQGLTVTCPDQTHVVIRGCDRQLVGQFAAMVRAIRKPEPYKGKGIRYQGEHVKLKPGKSAT